MAAIPPVRIRILVIDASIHELLELSNLLESLGYQIITALSLAIALEALRLIKSQVSLIVVVLQSKQEGNLPLRVLRSYVGFDIPIVVLGTNEQPAEIKQLLQAGCHLYLTRHCSLEEFKKIVGHCLAHPEQLL